MKKIILAIVFLSVVLIGTAIIIKFRAKTGEEVTDLTPTPSVAFPTVSENIKVSLTASPLRQAVNLTISGFGQDIESIEYELTYLTGSGLPRGVLGKITLTGEKEVRRNDLVLGTCSSGKCVYDTGVTSIDLSLKFNSSSGTSSIFQKTYPL